MSEEFYPPRLNPWLVKICQRVAPVVLRGWRQVDLEVDDRSLERLLALNPERVLLLPNHPTFDDPLVLFLLSAKLGQPFYYLAAYEQFHQWFGPSLQWMGAYSIRRGLADRTSIAQTLDLLVQPYTHLVIFPEGGCSFQNDTVMPFRAGAVQLAFQALNRFAKQKHPLPNLYTVPISIKYRYTGDMAAVIAATLSRLEQALGVPRAETAYDRLRTIAAQILLKIEQEFGCNHLDREHLPWNQRIDLLKAQVLQECEQRLSLTSAPGDPVRERVYRLSHALRTQAETLDSDDFWTSDLVQRAIVRLLNFDAIYDGYVAANPTPERFLDTVTRLEREVFHIDKPAPKGFRQAKLRIGEPINLKDFFEAYHRDRIHTVNTLSEQLRQSVQAQLDRMSEPGQGWQG